MNSTDQATTALSQPIGRRGSSLPALLVTLLLLNATPSQVQGKQVRLLIPILTGQELEQMRRLAPEAALVSINGSAYLQVGAFSDARVAHRLGRSIQNRLAIPFDLAYEPDDPQIAIALGDERLDQRPVQLASQKQPVQQASPQPVQQARLQPPPPKPPASDPIWSPLVASLPAAHQQEAAPAIAADDHGLAAPLQADSPGPELTAAIAQPQAGGESEPTTARTPAGGPIQTAPAAAELAENAQNLGDSTTSENWENSQTSENAENPENAESDTTPSPALAGTALATAPIPAAPPPPITAASEQPIEHPGNWTVASAAGVMPMPVQEAAPPPEVSATAADHPWVRSVPIAAVDIQTPDSSTRLALNPQLNYLFVKVNSRTELQKLNEVTKVAEYTAIGNGLVARVGVFTQTRIGRRLMNARIRALQAEQVDLIVAGNGQLPGDLA